MKRWVKGFAVAGVVMLCAGAGITALAGVMSGGRIGRVSDSRRAMSFFHNHVRDYLPFNLGDEIEDDIRSAMDEVDFSWTGTDGKVHHRYEGAEEDYLLDSDIWDESYDNWKISPKEEMTLVTTYKDVRELEVSADGAALEIVENSALKDQINIYMKKKDNWEVNCKTDDHPGEISVEYRYRGHSVETGYVEGIIEIPAGYRFDELKIEINGGIVKVPAAAAGELKLEANGGEISAPSFTADTLKLEVNGGIVNAAGSANRKVETEVNAGVVTLKLNGSRTDYFYEIENEMGEITVDGLSRSEVYELHRNSGTKKMELECNMGTISVKFE